MNPKSKRFAVRRCVVCGYPFSDRHHLYPKKSGGEGVTYLCPNHHRFANIIQIIVLNGGSRDAVKKFAQENFDGEFNEFLDSLLDEILVGARRVIWDAMGDLFAGETEKES